MVEASSLSFLLISRVVLLRVDSKLIDLLVDLFDGKTLYQP
jgi:hypothetical protein